MNAEAAERADFSQVRYAQCWEDADVLVAGLRPASGDVAVSIASAGDNTLALLAGGPAKVIALDLNPAQLTCLELRVAAYRALSHPELLELMGSRPSPRRLALYQRCRGALTRAAREFWDARPEAVAAGIGAAGRFERYFACFRRRILPLVHSRRRVQALLKGGSRKQRLEFFDAHWNTRRWRLLFRIFFSRFVMGRLGRDPSFFKYVEGDVAARIFHRVTHALTELDPASNPYLTWILTGRHGDALPFALRPENFDRIRSNLDRLEWRQQSVESFLDSFEGKADSWNLSDIFEYMSEENSAALLERIAGASNPGARLLYWNMLVPRSRPERMAKRLRPMPERARELFHEDKAFFYSRLVIEQVQ